MMMENSATASAAANYNFDSVQNIGTIVWTYKRGSTTFDQKRWDEIVELNNQSIELKREIRYMSAKQGL